MRLKPSKRFRSVEQAVQYRMELYLDELDGAPPVDVHAMVVSAIEKPLIKLMLQHAGGNKSLAAQYLGMGRQTLYAKMTQHKIEYPT
ncbi:hypothetical protein AX768_27140 [Burkholderia sp. PAMC 28687]|uniref:helix-turn-helix domain-containing protein n=1 Tax=Burkholderia sp. PAMC 28687 TaxID=1795874 RepID=UPI000782CE0E|nr:helix-turn-helix domain-containing protein [Burkholderia sp. PAMC 28687]AMM17829.1 hypothetical protein AX768_27140 [Burkholderia sp. PAMC 28687]